MAYHLAPRNEATLDNNFRLRPKPSRVPQGKIRQLAHLNTPNKVTKTLRECWVDGVLGYVSLDPEIICFGSFVLGKHTPLNLVLVRGRPRSQNNLPAATHSLRVTGHHANGTKVMKNILGRNRLASDTRLGESNVLGDILGKVMAHHQHVKVLIERVDREWTRGIGR